jgi:hypothetical protein
MSEDLSKKEREIGISPAHPVREVDSASSLAKGI